MRVKKARIKSQGLTMQRVIVTPMVRKIPYVMRTEADGRIRSSTAMSFEKRVKMRPIGVESKKRIFARTIFSDIALCKLELLRIRMLKIVSSLQIAMTKAMAIIVTIVLG